MRRTMLALRGTCGPTWRRSETCFAFLPKEAAEDFHTVETDLLLVSVEGLPVHDVASFTKRAAVVSHVCVCVGGVLMPCIAVVV